MRLSLWIRIGLRDWQNYVPIVPILRDYQRDDFSHDVVAGLVVGMVTIPQAVAYAFLAGVPPQSGLYACLVPMLLYAVFGSSRQLVVGPVAVAALMVAATVSEYAPKYSDAYLGITIIVCLQAGIILWLLRLSRMGGLVNLLSHPVITGFVNAAAILIIVSQLPAFTGISITSSNEPTAVLSELLAQMTQLDVLTVTIGLSALLILLIFPLLIRMLAALVRMEVPGHHAITRIGPMVVAMAGVLFVELSGTQDLLDTVGAVPAGLPGLTVPEFDPQLWLAILPASTIIALISYVESYSIGT